MIVHFRSGSAPGKSFHIKGPMTWQVTEESDHLRTGFFEASPGTRFAVRILAKSHGSRRPRVLICEVGSAGDPEGLHVGPFYLTGDWWLVERINDPDLANEAWRTFPA